MTVQIKTKISNNECDESVRPDTPNVRDFVLRLVSRYKDDVPIKDLKLTLDLNGTIIDNFELEKYIHQIIQEQIELTKNRIIQNILNVIK